MSSKKHRYGIVNNNSNIINDEFVSKFEQNLEITATKHPQPAPSPNNDQVLVSVDEEQELSPKNSTYDKMMRSLSADAVTDEAARKEREIKAEKEGESQAILHFFDSNNLMIHKNKQKEKNITEMIKVQKEYEKFAKCCCSYKILSYAARWKILIFNIIFLCVGLGIGYFFIREHNTTLYDRSWFYTIYLSFIMANFTITRILVDYGIMKLLRKLITNTWSVFYIIDIRNRIYLLLLCTLWFVGLTLWGDYVDYDYNDKIFKAVECLLISAAVFIVTYICIRYIALTSYFDIFRQRARTLKAYATFLQIMLNVDDDKSVFCMPLMNFLIDFPTSDQQKEARKDSSKHVEFNFSVKNIDMKPWERAYIEQMAKGERKKQKLAMDNGIITIHDQDRKALSTLEPNEEIKASDIDNDTGDGDDDVLNKLLGSAIYTVDLNKNVTVNTIKKDSDLKPLTLLLSYLILLRLGTRAQKLKFEDETVTNGNTLTKIKSVTSKWSKGVRKLSTAHMSDFANVTKSNLEAQRYKDHVEIHKELFLVLFKEYNMPNKELLIRLGQSAWNKFKDKAKDDNGKEKEILTPKVLSLNLIKIIKELLQLKQSIDSYIVIIKNLQRMIDVITPILLLFVYLYIFNLDFKETITLYVSSVGIIGFFGASYFGSVFASISFIIALNPFLVGDTIWFKKDFYKVREISLISCVFENCRTGWSHTFQNKSLSSMSHPIINLKRSGTMIYRFILYFKANIDNEFLYDLNEECKERIKQTTEEQLKYLDDLEAHKANQNWDDEQSDDGKEEEEEPNASRTDITKEECKKYKESKPRGKKKMYATFADLKSIEKYVDELRYKSVALDDYGRRQVFIELKYETYSWNVRTLAFSCITDIAYSDKHRFKKKLCDNVPIRMEGEYPSFGVK